MTPAQVKAQFTSRGQSIGKWADAHGFPRIVVYRLLNGRAAGLRGRHHEAAVALGLKPNPDAPQTAQ